MATTKRPVHPARLLAPELPFFKTGMGAAFCGDSLDLLQRLRPQGTDLVFTSPPYPLHRKKAYGNVSPKEYISWFMPFAEQIKRVLKESGSFVLNLGTVWNAGMPTQNLYHHKLVIELVETLGFHLAQELYWQNPSKLPAPAQWVSIDRERVKDSVEHLYWFSVTPRPKANNRNVLVPYSASMHRLTASNDAVMRPSGHVVTDSFAQMANSGAIPGNVIASVVPDLLRCGNTASNDPYFALCREAGLPIHPARFPKPLPEFFMRLLTDEDDLVVDPFGGSMTTGVVAEALRRRWIGMDLNENYIKGAELRFSSVKHA